MPTTTATNTATTRFNLNGRSTVRRAMIPAEIAARTGKPARQRQNTVGGSYWNHPEK